MIGEEVEVGDAVFHTPSESHLLVNEELLKRIKAHPEFYIKVDNPKTFGCFNRITHLKVSDFDEEKEMRVAIYHAEYNEFQSIYLPKKGVEDLITFLQLKLDLL